MAGEWHQKKSLQCIFNSAKISIIPDLRVLHLAKKLPNFAVIMEPIIRHFTDNDLYTFTCQYYILETYPPAEVEYTFYDRNREVYPQGFAQTLLV